MKHPNTFECNKMAIYYYKDRTALWGRIVQVENEHVWLRCDEGTRLKFHFLELSQQPLRDRLKLYWYKVVTWLKRKLA